MPWGKWYRQRGCGVRGWAALSLAAGLTGQTLASPQLERALSGPVSVYAELEGPSPLNVARTVVWPAPGFAPRGLRLRVSATGVAPGTFGQDLVVQVTTPTGVVFGFQALPLVDAFASISGAERLVALPAGLSAGDLAGTWSFRFSDTFADASATSAVEATLTQVQVWLEDAAPTPPATLVETVMVGSSGTLARSGALGVGQGAWYRLELAGGASAAGGTFFELVGGGVLDSALVLYDAQGVLRASDDQNGPGDGGLLSFGAGSGLLRGDAGDDEPRGLGQSGELGAGTHYALVTPTLPSADDNFVVQFGRYDSGAYTLTLASGAASVTPPTGQALGVLGAAGGAAGVRTASGPVGASGVAGVAWFSFTLAAGVLDVPVGAGAYVDIDTLGSSLPAVPLGVANDTVLALYGASGRLIASNDEGDGLNPLGVSSLSFGDTQPARASAGAGVAEGDGRDGVLGAGTYYVGVTGYPASVGAARFAMATAGGSAGTARINVRFGGLVAGCGPSDVAGPGQQPGADGELTADDVIVFISWFVAADARADVSGPGQQPGADGEFTADDVIVFISRFVVGC
jgi:hypothetical protein